IGGDLGVEPVMAAAEPENPAATMRMMEEGCERENLVRAWQRVRENKGAPGIDGVTIDDAKSFLREHLPDIRSPLLAGDLPAATGQTGRDTQTGRRGQETRRPLCRRQTDPTGRAAGSAKALGPDVLRAQLRLPPRTFRPSGRGPGATVCRRGLQRRGRL